MEITDRLVSEGSQEVGYEFACAKINAIDFVCINCCWNEVRVNSNSSVVAFPKDWHKRLT